jgi:hydroxypyruvate reductase
MAPTPLLELRRAARGIFADALAELDAGRAVERAVSLEGSRLRLADTEFELDAPRREIYTVAAGKAAGAMASALERILGERIAGGVVSAPPCDLRLPERWRFFAGGHPVPNAASLEAARAAFELLGAADRPSALVIFLISGGGSAMLEWPRDERLTIEDLRETNRVLVSCGAGIAEVNSVRRRLSAVKGGGLARRARRAAQVTLIISDTSPERAADVASGPTLPPPADGPPLAQLIARYDLRSRLAAPVMRALERAETHDALNATEALEVLEATEAEAPRLFDVLLDNGSAIEAAASAARVRGFEVELARDLVEQDVAEGSRALVERLYELRRRAGGRGVCLISGGEFSCPVRGGGIGGRNAETALRCALAFAAQAPGGEAGGGPLNVVALCAGTDGIDGNSPAAGAVSDQTTLERALSRGLDAQSFLERSDAYTLFDALGDAVLTGPTGTNVRDLRILLAV